MELQRRLTLADLTNALIAVVTRHGLSLLVPAAILFVPAGLLYALGFRHFLLAMANLIDSSLFDYDQSYFQTLSQLLGGYGILLLGVVIYSIGNDLLTVAGADRVFREMRGLERESAIPTIRRALKRWVSILGQGLILGSLFFCIILFLTLLPMLLIIAEESAWMPWSLPAWVLLLVVWFLVLLALISWFTTKTFFSATALAWSPEFNAWDGIGQSFRVTRKQFWRVFGLTLLFSLIISFAVGILSGPIIFFAILPAYIELFQLILSGEAPDLLRLSGVMQPLAWGLGASLVISGAATAAVVPLFQGLLFIDLKVRRGDLEDKTPPADPPPETPALP